MELTRIESVKVRRMDDDDPDLSWLEQPEWNEEVDGVDGSLNYGRNRIASYGDTWSMIGVQAVATVYINGIHQTLRSSGLWGIESDSDESYLTSVEDEQLEELTSVLAALGLSLEGIEVDR